MVSGASNSAVCATYFFFASNDSKSAVNVSYVRGDLSERPEDDTLDEVIDSSSPRFCTCHINSFRRKCSESHTNVQLTTSYLTSIDGLLQAGHHAVRLVRHSPKNSQPLVFLELFSQYLDLLLERVPVGRERSVLA